MHGLEEKERWVSWISLPDPQWGTPLRTSASVRFLVCLASLKSDKPSFGPIALGSAKPSLLQLHSEVVLAFVIFRAVFLLCPWSSVPVQALASTSPASSGNGASPVFSHPWQQDTAWGHEDIQPCSAVVTGAKSVNSHAGRNAVSPRQGWNSIPTELEIDAAHDTQQDQYQAGCSYAIFKLDEFWLPGCVYSQLDMFLLVWSADGLNHPSPCALTSPALFLHPFIVFQLPYLTARGVQHHRVNLQPRHQAVPTTFLHGRLGECHQDWVRGFISFSAGSWKLASLRKNLPAHKQRESTGTGNVLQVLSSPTCTRHVQPPTSWSLWADQAQQCHLRPAALLQSHAGSAVEEALQVLPAWAPSPSSSFLSVKTADLSFSKYAGCPA